jgi:adenine/guanine/hypoxanthine permease
VSEQTTPSTAEDEAPEGANGLDRYFGITRLGSSVRTEVIAGATTFLAMAYIVFVNPDVLSATGMDFGAVFVATCIAAAIGTLVMGLYAKLPVAQAPGMGLNAFFAFTVVLGMGIDWETALAATFVSGILFLILTLTGVRERIINAIPMPMKLAVAAGIGLFIAFIGLSNAEIVVAYEPTAVTLGDLSNSNVQLAIFGLIITALMLLRGLKGAVFYGIIVTAVVGMIFGLSPTPDAVVSTPPSLAPTFGAGLEAHGARLAAGHGDAPPAPTFETGSWCQFSHLTQLEISTPKLGSSAGSTIANAGL